MLIMKKTILFPLFSLILLFSGWFTWTSFTQQDECDLSGDLKKYYSNWGERCSRCGDLSGKSYTVRYRNEGKLKLDVRVALQRENKTWQLFAFDGVAPNDTFQVCVCNGTSKVKKWAVKAGDKTCILPQSEKDCQ